ncbi:L(+)-tartrate dehydratase subunit beta [Thalassobacillus devorans]|uniref:L(+)-tartrate dehydratase subunit beta n=1 Tax=Thalassobacillus devorans TaxID=279813 RepID=A0ABQ1NSL8_9BACI|nr:fumarate hydratase C-terminal domain-containing protein [Thalassobacillus devorans]NIK28773.1 L(+)-tartrate dehydratase beta subunit [Thalassobacillus devorans]GGC83651.1 L(+)-tartrate dehydratase subunit beta [Thalassobacillus devorans]
MAHYRLKAPLTDEDIAQLYVGDTVTLDGIIFGVRDANLIRLFDKKVDLPEDLKPQLAGAIALHTAPGVRKLEDGTYEKVSIGTTTSYRMDRFTRGLMEDYGVRVIVGKGGLLEEGSQALVDLKGCYFTILGGSAALETTQVEAIEDIWWEDLMPEAIWKFRVKDFGPLIVSIDSHGNNKYKDVKKVARKNLDEILSEI